jgi:hypothetical protein
VYLVVEETLEPHQTKIKQPHSTKLCGRPHLYRGTSIAFCAIPEIGVWRIYPRR